ncbi:MAG: hypothetical protein JRF65_14785 [Deltaproteobacteria bacterium]|nr:hypothetical protein [Deltaproteobacteria bacterium]
MGATPSTYVKRLIVWSIIGTGITSVTTQLLTLREFLSQFQGNEITISLVLFCWLLLGGLGSLLEKGVKRPTLTGYTLLLLVISVWPLVQLLLIRWARDQFFTHGASPGFYGIFFTILCTTAPYCLMIGFILPHAQKVIQRSGYAFSSGDLYLTDGIGDVAGGAIFSFVLVYWLKPFAIIALTSAFLILLALVLIFHEKRYVLPGIPVYSGGDLIESEEKIHFPLSQLDRVERVLLVSGGLGEPLGEIAKYRPSRVDYVELDPRLIDAARAAGLVKDDAGVQIMTTDARRFIGTTERTYDAIIIDLPDPDTFQMNRFFTTEFIAMAKQRLRPGGVLSLSMDYSPNYISRFRKVKLSILYNTLSSHFGTVMAVPAGAVYFVCRDGTLTFDIPERLRSLGIPNTYIEGFYAGNVTGDRKRQLAEALRATGDVNSDFEPRLMRAVFREWFDLHGTSPAFFIMVAAGLLAVYLIFMKRSEYVLFSTGLATMGVELAVIFAFQVIYGYIYLRIGAIVTAFLLGLLPGALVGRRWARGGKGLLLGSELLMLGFLLLFYFWTIYFSADPGPGSFLVYGFLFSCLCGFQFPVVARLIGESTSPAAGCLAADLCGAAVGAIATGALLIPFFGIRQAVAFLILVKISSSLMIMFSKKIAKAP